MQVTVLNASPHMPSPITEVPMVVTKSINVVSCVAPFSAVLANARQMAFGPIDGPSSLTAWLGPVQGEGAALSTKVGLHEVFAPAS